MKIMVSACLAGENCKYNGGNNRNEKVLRLMEDNEVITVCPEELGGLPTPRVPSEIKDGLVAAKDGRIVDAEFRRRSQVSGDCRTLAAGPGRSAVPQSQLRSKAEVRWHI